MRKIINIFGPNLNLLEYRNTEKYGNLSFKNLCNKITIFGQEKNIIIEHFQSNSELEIIEFIHELIINKRNDFDLMVNLGAFTHYSYAISDALEMLSNKCCIVEVHLSDISNREYFRKKSVLEHIRSGIFYGEKEQSYYKAINYINK